MLKLEKKRKPVIPIPEKYFKYRNQRNVDNYFAEGIVLTRGERINVANMDSLHTAKQELVQQENKHFSFIKISSGTFPLM